MSEYCDECRMLLGIEGADTIRGFRRCVPCWAKLCSRECKRDHERHCHAVQERRARAAISAAKETK